MEYSTVTVLVAVGVLVAVILYQGVISYLDRKRHDLVVKQLTAAVVARNASEYKALMQDQRLDIKQLKVENELARHAVELERKTVEGSNEFELGKHIPVT